MTLNVLFLASILFTTRDPAFFQHYGVGNKRTEPIPTNPPPPAVTFECFGNRSPSWTFSSQYPFRQSSGLMQYDEFAVNDTTVYLQNSVFVTDEYLFDVWSFANPTIAYVKSLQWMVDTNQRVQTIMSRYDYRTDRIMTLVRAGTWPTYAGGYHLTILNPDTAAVYTNWPLSLVGGTPIWTEAMHDLESTYLVFIPGTTWGVTNVIHKVDVKNLTLSTIYNQNTGSEFAYGKGTYICQSNMVGITVRSNTTLANPPSRYYLRLVSLDTGNVVTNFLASNNGAMVTWLPSSQKMALQFRDTQERLMFISLADGSKSVLTSPGVGGLWARFNWRLNALVNVGGGIYLHNPTNLAIMTNLFLSVPSGNMTVHDEELGNIWIQGNSSETLMYKPSITSE